MIAEAVDTVVTVARALLVVVVVGSAVATAVVYAVAAGVWWAWRVLSAAWATAAARRALDGFLSAELPSEDPEPPGTADRRSGPPLHPSPSWARKDAA